jgi:hypothetical protein
VGSVKKPSIKNMGGFQMGITIDQKINASIHLVKNCDDVDLLILLLNATHDRINELIEGYNEDIQE